MSLARTIESAQAILHGFTSCLLALLAIAMGAVVWAVAIAVGGWLHETVDLPPLIAPALALGGVYPAVLLQAQFHRVSESWPRSLRYITVPAIGVGQSVFTIIMIGLLKHLLMSHSIVEATATLRWRAGWLFMRGWRSTPPFFLAYIFIVLTIFTTGMAFDWFEESSEDKQGGTDNSSPGHGEADYCKSNHH